MLVHGDFVLFLLMMMMIMRDFGARKLEILKSEKFQKEINHFQSHFGRVTGFVWGLRTVLIGKRHRRAVCSAMSA
jgi:hypothetical protein